MPPKARKALRIEEFEPDEDILETTCKWKLWRRRLEIQMAYREITKPDDMKAALLVHGGDKILSIDENAAELEGELNEYETLIAKIEHVYVATNTRLHARFRFNKAVRQPSQSIAQYELELRRLARECDFHGYDDEMILDRLISTCEDENLQAKALENSRSLKDFLKYAITKQDVKAQRNEMNMEIKNESSDLGVRRAWRDKSFARKKSQKIYSFKNRENPRRNRDTRHSSEMKTCTKCGRDNSHVACPAAGKECYKCQKLGHFSAQCFSRNSGNKPKHIKAAGLRDGPVSKNYPKDSPDTSDSDPEFYKCVSEKLGIKAVKGQNTSNILLPVHICGTKIMIDPDTGADVDLISASDFKKIHEANPDVKNQIKKPKQKIYALNGEELEVIARIKGAKLTNRNAETSTDLYILEDGIHKYPLLSERTLLELGMIKYSAEGEFVKKVDAKANDDANERSKVQDKASLEELSKILLKHKKMFQGIGTLKNPESGEPILTHIEMNPDAIPVIQPPRPIPHHLEDRTKRKLDYFVEKGIMTWTKPGEPISYASPLVITPKGDDDVRITADFRMANKGASRTRIVPGLRIDELSATFGDCKIFSHLDMNNGYHLLKVDEDSKKYLVVTTPWGNLKHETLAQGWITSQDEFDRRINEILAGIPKVKCNRDDCLIGGRDWDEHNRTLETVLTRLQEHGLTLRLEKCEFGKEEVEFYGVRFTGEGIKPSKLKIKALQECGEPSSKEGVRSFLQMVGYMSRFITNFAQIAAPLRQLTKSTSTFQWGSTEQSAFDNLKNSLTEQTTLAYFVPRRPIKIYVDAGKKTEKTSNVPGGLCAILCQQDDEGQWKMCHVANRALTDVETRYGQTELEATAIKFACDHFYQYVVGAPKFVIVTDCKPLVHLFSNPKSRAPLRIELQILAIQGLDYVVKYEKGVENIADYGSRHIRQSGVDAPVVRAVNDFEEGLRTFVSENDEYLHKMARGDNDYQFLKEVIQNNLWKKHGKDSRVVRFFGVAPELSVIGGIILYKGQVIPPLKTQRRFVETAHKIGHSGETRTLKLLQERIWFPGIAKLCKEMVKNCTSCQATHDRAYHEPLQSTSLFNQRHYHQVPGTRFQLISKDHLKMELTLWWGMTCTAVFQLWPIVNRQRFPM